ncbi:hypothetical protein RCH10_000460 [Variovorax sp. GrIS 2.14]|uniref:hypothetical protein n=1 Tax=Variovorax sp. GrIS 2.14 TaxID=3071709 RepID=UPI0019B1D4AB|nr:hypothetical protein [Variovorax sp.]
MNSIDTEDFIAKRYEVLVERDVRYGEAMVDHGTTPRMRPLLLDIYRPQAAPVMAGRRSCSHLAGPSTVARARATR